jgi:hypothetical protein
LPTLILTPRHTPDSQLLARAARAQAWDVVRLPSWRVPDELRSLEEPVLYAEALLAPVMAEALGLALDEPDPRWLVDLPARYRQRDVELTTFAEARARRGPFFIKPPNDKSFPAQVCASGAETPDYVADDSVVLVQEPVTWRAEFRCFVLDGEVRTVSLYSRDGEPQERTGFQCDERELDEAVGFARAVVAAPDARVPPAVVIDVGEIAGRGFAVVELNAAWGAGLYACDPVEALAVIRASQRRCQPGEQSL